ncbi:MAG: crosslink repair DNA glycosylase YcaQ family protein [Dehalococcoidia bacterium]
MPRRTPRADRISADEARLLALAAQGFAGPRRQDGVPAMLRRVGAVQLDTISVLARSHELVAYARLGAVGRDAVEAAYWGAPAQAFEYYAHAACVLPIEAWPLFGFRRRALRARTARHSIPAKVVAEVRARLADGPVTASDLGGARHGPGGWWSWSAAKIAVEGMWLRGDVVCTTRRGWKRVYDLPERALPPKVAAAEPSDADCYSELVRASVRALGCATRTDVSEYYRLTWPRLCPAEPRRLFDAALAGSGLPLVEVEGWDEPAYADPNALATIASGKVAHSPPVLLSPFDSLVWRGKPNARLERIFGFALSLEAYKPKAQRVHGYFTMPLLAEGRLVGRVDPARRGRTLIARSLSINDPSAVPDMASALRDAASWVGCNRVEIERTTPRPAAAQLRRLLR